MVVDPAAFSAVCGLARQALAIEEGTPGRAVDLTGVADDALLATVRRHRVEDLFHRHAGALALPDGPAQDLANWHARVRPLLVVQAMETVRAWQALADAGVDALVIKGQPLAVLTTGRADARGAGDVDLFVDPSSVERAHHVLTAHGWRVPQTGPVEPGRWAWRHLNRWGHSLAYDGTAVDADLHWRLEVIPGAHPGFATFWSRRVEVDLGVGRVPTLSAGDALRHLAAHREGAIWLRTLVDLRRLARAPGLETELPPLALGYLAVARATVGLPDGIPVSLEDLLDTVPQRLLDYARGRQLADVRRDFGGGAGSLRSLADNRALSTDLADLRYAAMAAVLPVHAALPVRARSAWVGIPTALVLRVRAFLRGLRLPLMSARDAPCARPPGPGA